MQAPIGVLTDFSGGDRGRRLQLGGQSQPLNCQDCHTGEGVPQMNPLPVQNQTDEFLTDLDKVMPGIKARAVKKTAIIWWCAAIGWRSAWR